MTSCWYARHGPRRGYDTPASSSRMPGGVYVGRPRDAPPGLGSGCVSGVAPASRRCAGLGLAGARPSSISSRGSGRFVMYYLGGANLRTPLFYAFTAPMGASAARTSRPRRCNSRGRGLMRAADEHDHGRAHSRRGAPRALSHAAARARAWGRVLARAC